MSAPGEAPRTLKKRIVFGEDPLLQGFYWPESDQKRREILSVKRGSPAAFESTYQGRPGRRQGSIFIDADLNAFFALPTDKLGRPLNLQNGVADPAVLALTRRGHGVFQAWDTAFSTSSQSAHTVSVTGLFVSCSSYHCGEDPAELGPCEYHFDVLLLDVMRKRMDWGNLINAVKSQFHRWRPAEQIIEKKASGISLIQALESSGLPIVSTGATDSKGDRALNSVSMKSAGSVQGWFRQHRVLTPPPGSAPWLDDWRAEMKDFSGTDDASSDQVDATVHLVTRAILMGSSMAVLPSEWQPSRSELPAAFTDPMMRPNDQSEDPRAILFANIGMLPDLSSDPFAFTCARCAHDGVNFCAIQGRRMLSLDACDSFLDERTNAEDRAAAGAPSLR